MSLEVTFEYWKAVTELICCEINVEMQNMRLNII